MLILTRFGCGNTLSEQSENSSNSNETAGRQPKVEHHLCGGARSLQKVATPICKEKESNPMESSNMETDS